MSNKQDKPGTEIHRDAQRGDAGPQYHGKDWDKAEGEPRPGIVRDDETARPGVSVETGRTQPDSKRSGAVGEKGPKSGS